MEEFAIEHMLAKAIALAADVFRDKTDKQGRPYILHCLTVMNGVDSDREKICAVLHDVPEDIPEWDINHLRGQGYPEDCLTVIDLLTHKPEVPYMVYIAKIGTHPIATKIKLKDLEHNSQITRLKGVDDKAFQTMQKYHKAYTYLKRIQSISLLLT